MSWHDIQQFPLKEIDYIVEKRFYSKKNQVYKARLLSSEGKEKSIVIKKYTGPIENRRKEIQLLHHLRQQGLTVPKIYFVKEDYIVMEYIEGRTLLEEIEKREEEQVVGKDSFYKSNNEQLVDSLITWLKDFYYHTDNQLILKDINLRNFLINKQGKIYGIDFEDYGIGNIVEDGGKLCAYILTYNPPFTLWKLNFAKDFFYTFIEKFSINKEILLKQVDKEIHHINVNRNKDFSIGLFKNIIK